MSDQMSATPSATAAPATNPAASEEIAAAPWEARLWIISCVLASLGALLFGLSTWMPWVTATGYASVSIVNGHQQFYRFLLDPADIDGSFGLFGGSLLSVVGLLLLPFLWQQRSRIGNLLALIGYWVWAILLTVFVSANSRYFQKNSTVTLVPDLDRNVHTIVLSVAPVLQFGYWLHFAAIGIVTIAAILLPVTMLPGVARARLVARNSGRMGPLARIPGMGALTFALAVWAAGIFLFPWATTNCGSVPLIAGTCTGLPFTSALRLGINGHAQAFDPLVSLHAVGLLLGIGAALIFLTAWLGRITRSFYVWVALWLLAATFIAFVANAGVGLLVAHPAAQGLSGRWNGDNGIIVTFLGLLIGWGALLYLIINSGRQSAAQADA